MPKQQGGKATGEKRRSKRTKGRRLNRRQQKAAGIIKGSRYNNTPLPLTMRARRLITAKGDSIGSAFRAITLPRETFPMRMPTPGEQMKTAVFKLYSEGYMEHAPFTADASQNTCFMLCPSPVHPVWMTKTPSTAAYLTVNWDAENSTTSSAQTTFSSFLTTIISKSNDCPYEALVPAGNTGSNLVYIPSGASGTVAVAGGTGTATVTFELARWQCNEGYTDLYVASFALSGGAGSASVTSSLTEGGWYQLRTVNGSAAFASASTVFSLVVTVSTSARYFLPAWTNPISKDSLSSVRNCCRVTANSLLLSNSSAAVQRGGVIYAARIKTGVDGTDTQNPWHTPVYPTIVGACQRDNRYKGSGELGLYTYSVPNTGSMQYGDYYMQTTGYHYFSLADTVYMNIGYYTGSATTVQTSGVSSQEFSFQYDEHLEGVTNDQIFTLGVTNLDYSAYQRTLAKAANILPFTENPLHLATLAKIARSMARPFVPTLHNQLNRLTLRGHDLLDMI